MIGSAESFDHPEAGDRDLLAWTTEPLEPGESVLRRYPASYALARMGMCRGGSIRFTTQDIETMDTLALWIVGWSGDETVPSLADAGRHLAEAQSNALSDEARTQHLDIAGVRIWEYARVHDVLVSGEWATRWAALWG